MEKRSNQGPRGAAQAMQAERMAVLGQMERATLAGMNLPLDEDSRAPYLQTAEALRREISAGRLRPGDKLPSSRELQQRYQIASTTVQNALRVLREDGLIYSVQGKGTFVRRSAADSDPTPAGPDQETGAAADDLGALVGMVRTLMDQAADTKTAMEQMERRITHLEGLESEGPSRPAGPAAG